MTAIDAEQAMTVVGTIGGFAISLSLVPQVYLTFKTKCADDISYTYQFIYIFGTALVNSYAIYFKLYAVYIPCLVEFMLIVTLTIMKATYEPRQDLIDCSKQSIMISNVSKGSKGSVTSANLQLIQQLIASGKIALGDDEEAQGGSIEFGHDAGSKEFDKNMLRKSITILKKLSLQGHGDAEAPTEKKQSESPDVNERTGNSKEKRRSA